jgi:hypothetical protein
MHQRAKRLSMMLAWAFAVGVAAFFLGDLGALPTLGTMLVVLLVAVAVPDDPAVPLKRRLGGPVEIACLAAMATLAVVAVATGLAHTLTGVVVLVAVVLVLGAGAEVARRRRLAAEGA